MSREGLPSATRFLVIALSLLYALAAVAGPLFIDFDSTRDVVLWIGLLLGGALQVWISLRRRRGRP